MIHPVTFELVRFLDGLTRIDPDAMHDIVETRVRCNEAMTNHSTVQVVVVDEPGTPSGMVGLLGILNGFCGAYEDGPKKGAGPIAAVFDDSGKLTGFQMNVNETKEAKEARDKLIAEESK